MDVCLNIRPNCALRLQYFIIMQCIIMPFIPAHVECDDFKVACASGHQCISPSWQCDNEYDCVDHSDELECCK